MIGIIGIDVPTRIQTIHDAEIGSRYICTRVGHTAFLDANLTTGACFTWIGRRFCTAISIICIGINTIDRLSCIAVSNIYITSGANILAVAANTGF